MMADGEAPAAPQPERRTPAGVVEHWCEHPGCGKWGGFGFLRHGVTVWYCFEHRDEGER